MKAHAPHRRRRRALGAIVIAAMAASPLVVAPSHAPAETRAAARAHASVLDLKLPEVKFQNVALKDALEFLRDVSGANIHVNWRAIEAAGVNQDTQVNMHLREIQLRKAMNLLLSEAGAGVALTYYVDQNVIEVTTKELADKDMFTRVYPVEDLIVDIPDFNQVPDLSLLSTATNTGGGGGGTSGGGGGGGGSGGGGNGLSNIFNGGAASDASGDKHKTKAERADDLVALIREVIYPDVWRENGGPASIRYYNGSLVVTAPRSVHEALGGY